MPTRRLTLADLSPGRNNIAELIVRRGQTQAEAEMRSGEIWSNALQNVGQTLAGGLQQYGQQRQEKQANDALTRLRSPYPSATKPVAGSKYDVEDPGTDHMDAILGSVSPELRPKVQKAFQDFNEYTTKSRESALRTVKLRQEIEKSDQETQQHKLDAIAVGAHHASDWLSRPDGGLGAITMLSQQAKASGIDGAEQYDEFLAGATDAWQAAQGDPAAMANVAQAVREQAGPILEQFKQRGSASVQEKFAPKTRTLTTRNADGSEVEEIVEDRPGVTRTSQPKPATVGSFDDYVIKKYGRAATPEQIAEARKSYGQADDRPYRDPVPVVVIGPNGPQIVDRKTGQARSITGADGSTVGLAPTADERNRAAAGGRAQPVLQSISELSEKINTQHGVIAKISGAAEKVKAQANLNDDVAEYEAVVASFTPLLARAMGHTGVLTQQDVDSARAIIPKPEDSKSLRDRKIARIQKLLGGGSPAGDAAAAPVRKNPFR